MRVSLLLALLLVSPAGAEEEAKPIWLVVGPEVLTASIGPLAEFRKAEGFEVRIAEPPVANAIEALGRAPAFVLIVGDYEPGKDAEDWQVAPLTRPFYRWTRSQRTEFSTDSLYGDSDGDLMPDFPVGRIPARTAAEVAVVVAKTLAFERRTPTMADLRILSWGGAPGYGGLIDAMATGMLISTVRRYAPAWADRYLINSVFGNPLCGWPPDQPDNFNREWNRGAILASFVAHASAQAVFAMRHDEKRIMYHPGHAMLGLRGADPVAPAVFLTCYSGEFDGVIPSLAEIMLTLPGGPPVVIAATTESHPLTNLFTGRAMLIRLGGENPRIGNVWLDTQRAAAGMRDFLIEKMLQDAEGKLEDEIDIAKLRRDQALMYAILGDPAMKLKLPVSAPDSLGLITEKIEGGWAWTVPKPEGATRLIVGHRAAPKPGGPRTVPENAEEANGILARANAREHYAKVRAASADEDWTGEITEPGWYRFVVFAAGQLRVVAVELK